MLEPQPTARDIEELVAFLPRLYERGAGPIGKLITGRQAADGTPILPWYEYSETVESFIDTIRMQGCWLDSGYDPDEDQRLLMDEMAVARAAIPEIRRLLTLVVRGERFCDGWWLSMIEEGHVRRLLERLAETGPATIADALEDEAWTSHVASEGSKGPRLYDWARIPMPWPCQEGRERWLLIRRSRNDPHKRGYYLVFCHAGTTLAELAGAAGLRWTIEECFQRAKDDLGLDHCEARSWHGWHRHVSLVMAAAVFLARLAADLRRAASGKRNETSPAALIAV